MNSELELLKALAEIANQPQIDPEIEYRLHYNDHGQVVSCSMRAPHPDSSQYVVVDKNQYDNYHRYQVTNGQLQLIVHTAGVKNNLVKSDSGFKVVQGHPALIIEQTENYQDTEYYDYRTS